MARSSGRRDSALDQHTIADVRHPRDWAMGVIPGALRAPGGEGLAGSRVTAVIDQIGAEAPTIAERLGVPWIRGGFAAWLEDGGTIEPPPRIGRHQVGDPARLRGRDGWIRDIVRERDRVDARGSRTASPPSGSRGLAGWLRPRSCSSPPQGRRRCPSRRRYRRARSLAADGRRAGDCPRALSRRRSGRHDDRAPTRPRDEGRRGGPHPSADLLFLAWLCDLGTGISRARASRRCGRRADCSRRGGPGTKRRWTTSAGGTRSPRECAAYRRRGRRPARRPLPLLEGDAYAGSVSAAPAWPHTSSCWRTIPTRRERSRCASLRRAGDRADLAEGSDPFLRTS
jgi:rhodanese-related sulfurtransferase